MTAEEKDNISNETTNSETAVETVDKNPEPIEENGEALEVKLEAQPEPGQSHVADKIGGVEEQPDTETKPDTEERPGLADDTGYGDRDQSRGHGDRDYRDRDRGGRDRDRGGRDRGRRDGRPLTNEDKLRTYKKQSEERLLDIKRSKEMKVGKKRKR